MALLKSVQNIKKKTSEGEDFNIGINIIKKAFEKPVKQIVENSGLNGEVVLTRIIENDFKKGFDVSSEEYVDMFERGIIDPTSVVVNVVQNSISISSLVLITNAVVAKEEEQKDNN